MTAPETIPFFRPVLDDEEEREVVDTLRSGWLTTGPKTERFEAGVAAACGASDAVATTSGTAALHLALLALGIGRGDEVVTTAMTCAATVNVIERVGARPIFADIRPDTLTVDPAAVAAAVGPRTAAILPVHYAGHPYDVDAVAAVAARYGLAVVEDAAHAIGARHRGRPVGSLATATAFSFYATKLITTGEGGLLAGEPHVVRRARSFASHGVGWRSGDRIPAMEPVPGDEPDGVAPWPDVVEAGLKYRMSDLAASVGLAQLAKLPELLQRRRIIAARYTAALSGLPPVEVPTVVDGVEPAWHLYTLRIRAEQWRIPRDAVVARIVAAGGAAARQFRPVHREPFYRERYGDLRLPHTEREADRAFSLPVYPGLSDAAVDAVIAAVRRVCAAHSHRTADAPC